MPKSFPKYILKNYAHNIFQEFSKMRAFQSQVVFWQGFWPINSALLENGHFKNVQKRVLNFNPRNFVFFFFPLFLSFSNIYTLQKMVNKLADVYECPIDIQIYNFINTHLHLYYNSGFTPNMVTTFSILFGLWSAYQISKGHFKSAAAFMLIAYYFDCVDGKLARKYNMVTNFGDYYDHFGDLLKIVVIFYALFASNKKKITHRQWTFLSIFLGLAIIQIIHLGYQESIYNKEEESSFLNMFRKLIAADQTPEKSIHYTKYFGCGTWYLCFALLILFWRK